MAKKINKIENVIGTIKDSKNNIVIKSDDFIEEVVPETTVSIEDIMNKHQKHPEREWDVLKDEPIYYFDSNLSYELTGYRPINETEGLDFDPDWFIQARKTKEATKKYCAAVKNSKAYNEFWDNEYLKCINGVTINGYTITGDHYYFLNYYQIPQTKNIKKAGSGRKNGFSDFYAKQYEYFHYIELCKTLKKNAIGLKARGVGFSEIGASIAVNTYNSKRESRTVIVAYDATKLDTTLDKCWTQLNYLNDQTEDGFKKLRQKYNNSLFKRASVLGVDGVERGWMSEIEGIVADKPGKIRGDRTDLLMLEESGSFPNWKKAFIQADALVEVNGERFGIIMGWGTGS